MTVSHGSSTRGTAVQALLELAGALPVTWGWRSVPPLRLAVWVSGSEGCGASEETLVWVADGWYVAEVEPGEPPAWLARVDRPGEAAAMLARIVDASALVAAVADLAALGGEA